MSSSSGGLFVPGAKHVLIGSLQEQLQDLGFQCAAEDSVFGPQTVEALKKFQEQQGLPVTGSLDDKTWMALFQTNVLPADLIADQSGEAISTAKGVSIEINLSARQLTVYDGGRIFGTFPCAIGKPATPTPVGTHHVINKAMNPGGVFGTRWMGFTSRGHGMHGTNNPSSIGKAVSNGCVRMYNHHVETVYPVVSIGTPVTVVSAGTYHPPSPGVTPSPSPSPSPLPSPGGGQRVHTVQSGDSLYKIAQRYGTTVDAIMQANGLTSTLIHPGQQLIIP